MQAAVDGHDVEVELDDAVIGSACFGFELIEHASIPLVATCSQCRVGDREVEDRFDVDPRRAGHQPDQNPAETDPVRNPRIVATERVFIDRGGQDRLDRRPDRFGHLRVHRACHDRSASTGRLAWVALDMKIEPTRRPVDAHHLPARLLSQMARIIALGARAVDVGQRDDETWACWLVQRATSSASSARRRR